MQNISLFKLFLIFIKIGAILLGGGYVILPIMISEFVEKRKLITNEEMLDYFALSQSLPGIVAANISMFIGYKLKGKLGAIVGMFGIIFVPFLTIIILASTLEALTNNSLVQGAFWGVEIAVIALIILTVREMWQKTNTDYYFYLIFGLALLSLLYLKLTPIQTILIFTILGICYKKLVIKQKGDKQ